MPRILNQYWLLSLAMLALFSCQEKTSIQKTEVISSTMNKTAKEILGNPEYQAISFGAYRAKSRDVQPTIEELKEDLKILSALGIKLLRTYNVKLAQAANLLRAISEMKQVDPNFEMYVMLGAWIDCKNAWTDLPPDHNVEALEANTAEIERAVALANKHQDIVKIIAVGNEAMVKWATSYFVQPAVILKWVTHLQNLKKEGKLPSELWITSSDNFASWGGGDAEYHTEDLRKLIQAVDYVSLHTYPMHDTHYNPNFWGNAIAEQSLPENERIQLAMERALSYAQNQYRSTANYVHGISPGKPVHIGETGWASASNGHYGVQGSKATDEFKEGLYYRMIREWTNKERIACFYFEAFDEPWKDAGNPGGSENHFGLFTVDGQAKYALWDLVDNGIFRGLSRNGHSIGKTFNGQLDSLMATVALPPVKEGIMNRKIDVEVNSNH